MSEIPEIVPLYRELRLGEVFEHEGIKYVSCATMANILGSDKARIVKYAHMGMPHASVSHRKRNVYPVNACIEWYRAQRRRNADKAVVNGEMYYNVGKLAEATGYNPGTIHTWGRLYGMPYEDFPQFANRMYPLIRCLQWIDEYMTAKEQTAKSRDALKAAGVKLHPKPLTEKHTLCWDCQNARAGRCSWFTNYTPVEGWTADKTKWMNSYSYNVRECPLFERDEPRAGIALPY